MRHAENFCMVCVVRGKKNTAYKGNIEKSTLEIIIVILFMRQADNFRVVRGKKNTVYKGNIEKRLLRK